MFVDLLRFFFFFLLLLYVCLIGVMFEFELGIL